MRKVIADSLVQIFFPVESNPYQALACIPASAGAYVVALRSNSTEKSCISRLAGSWLKVKEDIIKLPYFIHYTKCPNITLRM